MSKLFIILILVFLPVLLLCQNISNIRITQDEIGIYKVYYDLSGETGKSYTLSVSARKDNKTITPKAISGSIGSLSVGKDQLLMWDPVLDGYNAQGWMLTLNAKIIFVDMVFVEGGTFTMGDTTGGGGSDERPTHLVTLSSFYLSKYEVTQKQWQSIMGTNPANFKGSDLPVEQITWYDCVEFCNKLSQKEGLTPCYSGSGANITCNWNANGYRLPTEAEWEYAARGGNKSNGYKYAGSNDVGSVAWFKDNSASTTHQVGQKQANELGLHDMSGNVYEWCWDRYEANYYSKSPAANPKGADAGTNKVMRGGSWGSNENYYRVSDRHYRYSLPDLRDYNAGFRLLRAQ